MLAALKKYIYSFCSTELLEKRTEIGKEMNNYTHYWYKSNILFKKILKKFQLFFRSYFYDGIKLPEILQKWHHRNSWCGYPIEDVTLMTNETNDVLSFVINRLFSYLRANNSKVNIFIRKWFDKKRIGSNLQTPICAITFYLKLFKNYCLRLIEYLIRYQNYLLGLAIVLFPKEFLSMSIAYSFKNKPNT